MTAAGRIRDTSVEVAAVQSADPGVVAAFGRLLPQLSASAGPVDREAVERIVSCTANTVLVARSGGEIVGTLTLALALLPARVRAARARGGRRYRPAARGQGIAALLTGHALRAAREAGARGVDLTSRPERAAANRLHERLGFVARRSTVHRFAMGEQRGTGGGSDGGSDGGSGGGADGWAEGGAARPRPPASGAVPLRPRGSGEGNGPPR